MHYISFRLLSVELAVLFLSQIISVLHGHIPGGTLFLKQGFLNIKI